MSDHVCSVSPETLNHFFDVPNLVGMAVCYHEVMCHVKKIVHFLQCQGHSEGLCNKNMTIFTVSSKLLVLLQPDLIC